MSFIHSCPHSVLTVMPSAAVSPAGAVSTHFAGEYTQMQQTWLRPSGSIQSNEKEKTGPHKVLYQEGCDKCKGSSRGSYLPLNGLTLAIGGGGGGEESSQNALQRRPSQSPVKQSVSTGAEHERSPVCLSPRWVKPLTYSPAGFTTHSFCDLDLWSLGHFYEI